MDEKEGRKGWRRLNVKDRWKGNMRKMDEKDGCKGYMRGDENDGG